jgi:hypothetical protein
MLTAQAGILEANGISYVPEPASLGMMPMAGVGILHRRRFSRSSIGNRRREISPESQ